MSIRSQAPCLALFLVLYCSPAFAPRPQAQAPTALPSNQAAESWREVMASELEPETFYCPIAYTRAPFVNVYALYRRGAPEIPQARSEAPEPADAGHFLLAGQQTAELRSTAITDVIV